MPAKHALLATNVVSRTPCTARAAKGMTIHSGSGLCFIETTANAILLPSEELFRGAKVKMQMQLSTERAGIQPQNNPTATIGGVP